MEFEISKYDPCDEALEFRGEYETPQEAWGNCHRGDWMLWIAKMVGVDLKILTKAKAKCALTVMHLMKDKRSIAACEIALSFSDGKATMDELNAAYAAAAASAAHYAADYAAYAAADYADYAAAASADYAAYAAAAEADYASAAHYAADYAAYAAASAADYARKKSRMETANICREILTDAVFEKFNLKQLS